jgi:16S rRNA (cytosine1402-N4)-methyltransferase
MNSGHTPVMLGEVMSLLNLRPGMKVVDTTVGCGGHAEAILEKIGTEGVLVGIDWDIQAIERARTRLGRRGYDVRLHRRNFAELKAILDEEDIRYADALLFDLGVSSLQLENGGRGFSFSREGPLDMRMDQRREKTADRVLRESGVEVLTELLKVYGEEDLARPIAREIVRRGYPGMTTELAAIVARVYRRAGRRSRINPSTRVFQALRIVVNEELENLREALPQAVEVASPGARIVVISFHSLEDRIVKEEFSRFAKGCICPPSFPVCRCGRVAKLRLVTRRPKRPSAVEVEKNPRSRSARLRAAEKI